MAAYFGALGEPTRLAILQQIGQGECTVGALAQLCGCSAANVSRHLAVLLRHGLVQREMRGQHAWYRCADTSVGALCDGVCAHLGRLLQRQQVVRGLP